MKKMKNATISVKKYLRVSSGRYKYIQSSREGKSSNSFLMTVKLCFDLYNQIKSCKILQEHNPWRKTSYSKAESQQTSSTRTL